MYGLIVFDHDGLICWFAARMASGYLLKAQDKDQFVEVSNYSWMACQKASCILLVVGGR